MKLKDAPKLLVAICTLLDSVRRSASLPSRGSGSQPSGERSKSRLSALERMLYYSAGAIEIADQVRGIYRPELPDIDAFRPRCGLFKQHQSFLDSNAFECVGGHHALPDNVGNLTESQRPKAGLVRRRRMAGGHRVLAEEAPYYAQLVGFWGSEWRAVRSCGGTIIHKNLVLTAAHCLELIKNITSLAVVVGANYLNIFESRLQHDGTLVHVDKRVIERAYERNWAPVHDLALLKLSTNLVYSDRVQPACMRLQTAPRNNAICFASGRGALDRRNVYPDHISGLAMELDPASHNKQHDESFVWRPLIEATICSGDSGAGLICYDSCDDSGVVRAHLVGVLSFYQDHKTYVCEERNQGGGFVNLRSYRDRMRAMMDEIFS